MDSRASWEPESKPETIPDRPRAPQEKEGGERKGKEKWARRRGEGQKETGGTWAMAKRCCRHAAFQPIVAREKHPSGCSGEKHQAHGAAGLSHCGVREGRTTTRNNAREDSRKWITYHNFSVYSEE